MVSLTIERSSEDIGPPIVVTPHKTPRSNSHCPIVFPQWTNSSLASPTAERPWWRGLLWADLSSLNQVQLPLSIQWVTISLFCHLFPLETIIYHYIPLQNIGWNSYYFLPQLTSCNQMVFLDFLPAQSEHYSRVSSISRHSLTLLILDWTIISQISMEIFSCIYETNPGEIPSFLFPQFSAQYSLSVDLQRQISKIKREGSKFFTQQWLLFSLVATGYFVCSEVVRLSVRGEEKQQDCQTRQAQHPQHWTSSHDTSHLL